MRDMMFPLAGGNKLSLSGSSHANSRATNLERLNQIGWPLASCFSRQVLTKRALSTFESAGYCRWILENLQSLQSMKFELVSQGINRLRVASTIEVSNKPSRIAQLHEQVAELRSLMGSFAPRSKLESLKGRLLYAAAIRVGGARNWHVNCCTTLEAKAHL